MCHDTHNFTSQSTVWLWLVFSSTLRLNNVEVRPWDYISMTYRISMVSCKNCSISSTLAMQILQPCIKPSLYGWIGANVMGFNGEHIGVYVICNYIWVISENHFNWVSGNENMHFNMFFQFNIILVCLVNDTLALDWMGHVCITRLQRVNILRRLTAPRQGIWPFYM